jgi:hypothetical protein
VPPETVGALAISCLIGLVWFDELWAIGESAGFWLGTTILKHIVGDGE